MTQYVLPDLPYDYAALEPHISAEIMKLHHDKHHAAYVKGANENTEKLAAARDKGDFAAIGAIEQALAFHISGHVMHSIFWRNLAPKAGGEPKGDLAAAITKDFGSFDKMKTQLIKATATIMGSGWGALVWDPLAQRLNTVQVHDHQSHVAQGSLPLLVIDAWEHAFYLQYKNEKAKFFEAIWNVFNWDDVADRFAAARKADLRLPGSSDAPAR